MLKSLLSNLAVLLLFLINILSVHADEVPGVVNGQTTVSLTGSAQYNIPIVAPAGASGMAPKLFVTYDSNSGPDRFGLGWSLTGFSYITRTNRTYFFDKNKGGPAPIKFNDDDVFSLDGARLVDRQGPGNYLVKAIDDQTIVEKKNSGDNTYFVGRTKAGLRIYYGESEDSRIKTKDGNIFVWAASRVEDTFGNWIIFKYQNINGDWGPSEVFYTLRNEQIGDKYDLSLLRQKAFASIKINYADSNSEKPVRYLSGDAIERSQIITSITSYFKKKPFRTYEFKYEEIERFGNYLLKEIEEIGADLDDGNMRPKYRPTRFEYSKTSPGWNKQESYKLPEEFGEYTSLKSGYRAVDVDNDGVDEILYSAQLGGKLHSRAYKFASGVWSEAPNLAPPVPLGDPKIEAPQEIFIDLNNDNLKDLLISYERDGVLNSQAFLQTSSGWKEDNSFRIPFSLTSGSDVTRVSHPIQLPMNTAGILIWDIDKKSLSLWRFSQGTWIEALVEDWEYEGDIAQIHFGDFNCDSKENLSFFAPSTGEIIVGDLDFGAPENPLFSELAKYQTANRLKESELFQFNGCHNLLISEEANDQINLYSLHLALTSDGVEIARHDIELSDLDRQFFIDFLPARLISKDSDEMFAVFSKEHNKNASVFTFDEINQKWSENPDFVYSPGNPTANIDESFFVLASPVNADPLDSILLLPASSGVRSSVLINKNPGFEFGTDLVPSVYFSNEEAIGANPQFIDLNADGLIDLIGYHKDKDNKTVINTAQINTSAGWLPVPSLRLPKPLTHDKGGKAGAFVDFNYDGIADYIYAYGNESSAWTIEFDAVGNPVQWKSVSDYQLPDGERFSDPKFGDRGIRFIDLNADGKVDISIARRSEKGEFESKSYINNDSGWIRADAKFDSKVPYVSRHKFDVHFETRQNQGDYFRDLRVSQIDLNGDGLLDALFSYGHNPGGVGIGDDFVPFAKKDGCLNPITEAICSGAYYNTGNGWLKANADHLSPVRLDINITEENASIDVVDINGDGLVDLLPARNENGNNKFSKIYLNSGKAWVPNSSYAVPVKALSKDKKLVSHRVLDLNGDGLLDIGFNRPGAKGVYLNTGVGWKDAGNSFAPPEAFINDKGEDLGVRIIDVDGNGLPDSLKSWRGKKNTNVRSAYLNTSSFAGPYRESRTDVLKSIKTGMGAETRLQYRSLLTPRAGQSITNGDFYTPSPISSYPTISYVPTMYAVEKMTIVESDASTLETRFQYRGFRYSAVAATPLGFESRRAVSYINGTRNITEDISLYQDYYRNGRVRHEESSLKGQTLSKTQNTYSIADTAGVNFPKRITLESSLSQNWDLDGTNIGNSGEYYRYDKYNNALEICVEYGDGSRTLTQNSYDERAALARPNIWFLGRLVEAKVTHTRTPSTISCHDLLNVLDSIPNNQKLENIATFEYDVEIDTSGEVSKKSSGVLTTETANAGHPLAISKVYSHDIWGNRIITALKAQGAPPRVSTTEFDKLGRFPISETNALGHNVSRVYDQVLGLAIKTIDANGVSISNKFDGFGRIAETVSPSGLISSQTRSFEDGPEIFGRKPIMSVTEQIGQLPPKKSYFDHQGRILKSETIGFGGKKVIQETDYDPRGRIRKSSLPYFEGETKYFSRTVYDELNRPIKVVAPDTGVTSTEYDGLQTKIVDANGLTTTKIQNEKGLTLKTIDSAGGELEFVYGPGDRLLSTIQVDGNELINKYDQIGNKVTSIDPDLGQWDYNFNAFGEVIWQRDAKGQITTVEYDLLGRPLKRVMPDNIEEFSYDTSAKGVGKPTAVVNTQGYSESYTYDNIGRLKRKQTKIDRDIYQASYSYDEYDRVISTAHPGNFRTQNTYDEFGFLEAVLANDPSKPFLAPLEKKWSVVERDQFGRVIHEKYGNGVKTQTGYDPVKGNVSKIQTMFETNQITDLELEYDLVGNLKSKIERVSGRSETFEYDTLYRIDRWDLNGKTKGQYRYDAAGRIEFKSDLGRYSYKGDGPVHGVKRVDTFDGKTQEYHYDANGNMIFGPKGRFEYYSNNMVRLIYKSDGVWSKFRYAPDGSRYHQQFSQEKKIGDMRGKHSVVMTTTVGAYEKIVDHSATLGIAPHGFVRHRLYIATDTGVAAIIEDSTQYDPLHGYNKQKLKFENEPLSIALSSFKTHYLHTDQLGSVTRVTDAAGKVVSGYEYDPWGLKTQTIYEKKGRKDFAQNSFRRGFTGHEHLENLELVHMNGRVYDPNLAKFVSADPFVQEGVYSQSYNRYSYVLNNPLKFVDPTGYFFKKVGNFLKKAGRAIAKPFEKAGRWLKKNWREVTVAVVAVAITVASAGTLGPVAAGMLAGAVSSGLHTSLYGGDLNDVFRSAVKGAIIGGISAGFAYGVGELGLNAFGSAIGHGASQGLIAEATGGSFGQGFLSGAFSSYSGSYTSGIDSSSLQIISGAVVGGTAAVIGGGKFANGAITGAFVVAFNHRYHQWKKANALKAFKNYLSGGGNIEIPLDTVADAFGIDLSKHIAIASKFESSIIMIDEKISFTVSGFNNYHTLGDISVRLQGEFSSSGSSWYFKGEIRGYHDDYNFHKALHRSSYGEAATRIGSMFSGTPFQIKLGGSVPVGGSGFLQNVN